VFDLCAWRLSLRIENQEQSSKYKLQSTKQKMPLSGYEALFFWIFALAAIFAGLLTVMARNAVHSALFLISSLVSVAALFVLARAEFVAGVQILVYVGGVMVLFLFVIMLVNVGAEERGTEEIFNRPRQVATSLIFCLLLAGGLLFAVSTGYRGLQALYPLTPAVVTEQQGARDRSRGVGGTGTSRMTSDTEGFGSVLYRYAALPFEIASVLLLVAIIGSVMLARTLRQEASADDLDPDVRTVESVADPELAKLESQTE
jgi:NADH-quinone oxidoreductase subunit J